MLGYTLALLIGLSLGILGGGGSILTVPIFVYAMGYPAKEAIAMSLPVVGATSFVGALEHWRSGNIDLRVALLFGLVAVIGARAGAELAKLVPGVVQLTLLGAFMIVAAALMLRGRSEQPDAGRAPRARRRSGMVTALATVAIGLGVGLLTGLVGIGGGFLFVPALALFANLPIKRAVGTSLLVIALSTGSASFGYHGQAVVPWRIVMVFTAVAVLGIMLGTRVVERLPARALRRAFAYFLFVMAAFILFQNRAVFAHPSAALHPTSAGAR